MDFNNFKKSDTGNGGQQKPMHENAEINQRSNPNTYSNNEKAIKQPTPSSDKDKK